MAHGFDNFTIGELIQLELRHVLESVIDLFSQLGLDENIVLVDVWSKKIEICCL